MRRREFLGGVGTAIACTMGASAQQIGVRRVGFLGCNCSASAPAIEPVLELPAPTGVAGACEPVAGPPWGTAQRPRPRAR